MNILGANPIKDRKMKKNINPLIMVGFNESSTLQHIARN
jgi:hypothetical protein